jgi:hypothetical protein
MSRQISEIDRVFCKSRLPLLFLLFFFFPCPIVLIAPMAGLTIPLVTARKCLFSSGHKTVVWVLAPQSHNAASLWAIPQIKAVKQDANVSPLEIYVNSRAATLRELFSKIRYSRTSYISLTNAPAYIASMSELGRRPSGKKGVEASRGSTERSTERSRRSLRRTSEVRTVSGIKNVLTVSRRLLYNGTVGSAPVAAGAGFEDCEGTAALLVGYSQFLAPNPQSPIGSLQGRVLNSTV